MAGRDGAACPSEDELLRLSSGELSTRRARAVETHVDGCGPCRARLESYAQVFAVYRTYAAGPDRSAPETGLGELRRSMRAQTPPPRQSGSRIPWAMQAAAALLVGAILIFWTRQTEVTLSAEALIARAVDGERAHPSRHADVVTIALTAAAVRAPAEAMVKARPAAMPQPMSQRGQIAQEFARRLAMHAFDWQAPLSARPFQHWRASVAASSDSLEWIDDSLVRIATVAGAGTIRSAELTLEAPDYRTVRQVWRFADGFEVELRSAPSAPRPVSSPVPMVVATRGETATPIVTTPLRSLDETELEVRVALDGLGVTFGRSLALRRGRHGLAIDGSVATPQLARAVSEYAAPIARVEARVRSVDPASAAASADVPHPPGLDRWLARTFGGGDLQATFVARTRVLEARLDDAEMTLRELAARYPGETAARLPAPARAQLDRLVQVYYRRLTASFEDLERHLAPLTGTLSRRVFATAAPSDWRGRAARLRDALDRVDAAIAAVAADALETPDQVERTAHDVLRPALAAVASVTAG